MNANNSSKNNLTAVMESRAYFIGPTFTERKYRPLDQNIANEQVNRLERQRRDDSVPRRFNSTHNVWEGWIPWGMVHDLIDTGEPPGTGINDQVSGYTINGIFKGYHSNSTTVQGLKSAILSHNNNHQLTQVNNLVTSYGW